jgi:hypothetical protein
MKSRIKLHACIHIEILVKSLHWPGLEVRAQHERVYKLTKAEVEERTATMSGIDSFHSPEYYIHDPARISWLMDEY